MEEKNILQINNGNKISPETGEKFCLVIPAFNPNWNLVHFVKNLSEAGYRHILVVNDGSEEECDGIFEALKDAGCDVLRHTVNMGKGRALKDAFNYVAVNKPECTFIITLDSEGNQKIESINRIAEITVQNPNRIITGSRDYKSKNIKKKKAFTNFLTRVVMALLCGVTVKDTRATMRGFSVETAKKFINTSGERYDFETNVLLESKTKNVKITEVKIEDENFNNQKSHFNPLTDSFNMYKLFVKYIFVALLCYGVELGLFRLLMAYLQIISPLYYTILDTFIARIASSLVGFIINKKKVFKKDENSTKWTAVKYYTVTGSQMLISALTVWSLNKVWSVDVVIIKMIIDFILFCLGFVAQREWVFKTKKKKTI